MFSSTTATIKRVLNQLDIDINKSDIKLIGIKNTDGFNYKLSTFDQLLKVNLSNVPTDNVFSLLDDTHKIDIMHANSVYIHDIYFKRDYKGVFNKRAVIKHLVHECDFVKQGKPNPDGMPVIIDNSKHVYNNCLTFISTLLMVPFDISSKISFVGI